MYLIAWKVRWLFSAFLLGFLRQDEVTAQRAILTHVGNHTLDASVASFIIMKIVHHECKCKVES